MAKRPPPPRCREANGGVAIVAAGCRHEPQRRALCAKSHSRKLNDTQLIILSSASQREDGLAVLPKGVRAASLKAAVIRLTKLGFLKQVRVKRDQPQWLTDEEDK